MRSGYCSEGRVRNDSPFLAEIDADGVGVCPILENRRGRGGRCGAYGREGALIEPRLCARLAGARAREGELLEPRIAARLADAYEAERASRVQWRILPSCSRAGRHSASCGQAPTRSLSCSFQHLASLAAPAYASSHACPLEQAPSVSRAA